MTRIFKYTIDPFEPHQLRMPRGARILHVHEQNGQLRLWAEVDPDAPEEQRPIRVVPTGGDVPDFPWEYVGSLHITEQDLQLVFHIYDGARTLTDVPVTSEDFLKDITDPYKPDHPF